MLPCQGRTCTHNFKDNDDSCPQSTVVSSQWWNRSVFFLNMKLKIASFYLKTVPHSPPPPARLFWKYNLVTVLVHTKAMAPLPVHM